MTYLKRKLIPIITLLFMIITIPVVVFMSKQSQDVRSRAEESVQNRTINFNLSSSRPIPKYIHGVNQNWFKNARLDHKFIKEGVINLGFTNIRFPGGTVSNYYDWEHLTPNWEYIMKTENNVPAVVTQSKTSYDANIITLSAIDFMKTAKDMGKDVLLVLNVLTNTPKQVKVGLEKIKQDPAGLKVRSVEMGNELYNPDQNTKNISTEKYLARSKQIADWFPDAKIGLIGNKNIWTGKETFEWNIPNGNWYDAIAIHAYTYIGVGLTGDRFIRWITTGRAAEFGAFVTRFRSSYPDKKLWLTEWNIFEEIENLRMTNTYAHSYYVYDFLLNLLRYPEITRANFHALSPGTQFKVFDVKREYDKYFSAVPTPLPSVTPSFAKFTYKLAPYWPLAWIGKAFAKYDNFVLGTITGTGNNDVTAVYFYNKNEPNRGSLSLINKNSSPVKIFLTGIDLSGQQLKLATLVKPWNQYSTESAEFTPLVTNVSSDNIVLPGYAIAYLYR